MGFFKKLFGGRADSPEDDRKEQETRNFDMLKYDGVKAMHMGETDYAVKCFNRALEMREDLEVRDYLSQTLIRTGELLPAYEQLQKLAEAEPDNKQIFVRMADVAYMMEDYRAMPMPAKRPCSSTATTHRCSISMPAQASDWATR